MNNEFNYGFHEPLNPNFVEKGTIDKKDIIKIFEDFPWNMYLTQIVNAKGNEIHYSPSLFFENTSNKHGIELSAVGNPNNYIFYIFYVRPKNGDEKYFSDALNQSKEDGIACLNALINGDLDFLEKKFE